MSLLPILILFIFVVVFIVSISASNRAHTIGDTKKGKIAFAIAVISGILVIALSQAIK